MFCTVQRSSQSEVLKYLIKVLLPEVAERVLFFAITDDFILLQKGIINDPLRHRHVNIHGCLHRNFLLQLNKLVIVNRLRQVFPALCLVPVWVGHLGCAICFLEEWHGERSKILPICEGSSADDLGPIVAIMVRKGFIRDKWRGQFPTRCLLPIDPLKQKGNEQDLKIEL